jgi:hypothetical protein
MRIATWVEFPRVVPGERRDPYAVSSRFGNGANAFCNQQCQGLWIPAFAGTTRREVVHSPPWTVDVGVSRLRGRAGCSTHGQPLDPPVSRQ